MSRAGSSEEIIVTFVYPPIPVREFDYSASWENDEPDEEGHWRLMGYGRTPLAAIIDLLNLTEEE